MASIYTASHGISGNARIDYSYTQNYANNTSYVTLKAYIENMNDIASGIEYDVRLTIDGTSVVVSAIANEGTTYIGQYSKTITHNSNGTKQIYIQGVYDGYYTNNTLLTLATIPRYANFTEYWIHTTALNSVSVWWQADAQCDRIQYSLDGGDWIESEGWPILTQGGLEPNTTHTIRLSIRRTDSQLWTEGGYLTFTTKDIARVTSANNVTDEQNPYFTFTNPSGAVLKTFIEVLNPAQTICQRDAIPNTGNYTFTLSQAEKNLIYAKCSNTNSTTIRYWIVTKVNGVDTYWNSLDKTITIVNANPTFTNFTYLDSNATTVALTGSNQKVVKGYSNVKATISVANKAVALKGATMSKYTFKAGTKQVDGTYSSSSAVDITINGVDNSTLEVYAVDSRGNSTKKEIVVSTFLAYTPVNVLAGTAVRGTGGIGTAVTLDFNGAIWNSSFGSVANSIVSCIYKYKKTTDSTYITGTTNIVPTLSGNTYSKSVSIIGDLGASGFDNRYSYNIQVIITDRLTTYTKNITLQSGTPQLALGVGEGVAVGGFYDEVVGGTLQVSGQTKLFGTASSNPLITRGIQGSDGVGGLGDLYLNYNNTNKVFVNGKDIMEKNIMTAYITGRPVVNCATTFTAYKIPLSNAVTTGSKLTFNNTTDVIVVGAGVSKIKISGRCTILTTPATAIGEMDFLISKTGAVTVNSYDFQNRIAGQIFNSYSITERILDVVEGDYVYFGISTNVVGNYTILGDGTSTYLTVEVVE